MYSSPEIITGTLYLFQPDIWNIGMLIYFICSCLDPFDTVHGDIDYIKDMISSYNVNSFISIELMIIELLSLCKVVLSGKMHSILNDNSS